MKLDLTKVDRRTLLIGGGVGVGLVVAFLAWPRSEPVPLRAGKDERAYNAFVKIGRDGRVTIAAPQAETGQGAWTALPQILADELGAAWEMVAVEPAPAGKVYANPLAEQAGWLDGLGSLRGYELKHAGKVRITAGSTSVRAFEQALREAGAMARSMLIAAAAERWGVEPAECDTADGFVIHEGKTLGFGELAEEAARIDPPENPQRRESRTGRLMGQGLPRLDLPAKSDGSLRFAGDVRLPDMLFASARLAPPGGRLTGFSSEAAKRQPGVREIVFIDEWVAVAADNWWAAEQAIRRACPRFSGSAGTDRDGVRARVDDALETGDAERWFSRGDYDEAVEGSRPLAATYWVAPAQHLGLEPLTATARFNGGRLEVWAPTQAPEFARAAASKAAGDAASSVILYPMPVGDSGGRSLEADALPIAIELARRLGRPVQLSLSPAASQNHDRVAPPVLARTIALPGADGTIAAWKTRIATADGIGSALARLDGGDPPDAVSKAALDGAVPPYAIPNIAIEAVPVMLPFRAGYMRGEPHRSLCFATESFVDELARRSGAEPLAFRMSMLGGNMRLANCLARAAALAGWDGGGPGSTMGLAACSAYGSHIGLVANASVAADQRIQVHKLVAVVDCGRIVNPQLVRQQIEGGLLWALGLATVREPEWVAGMPRSRTVGALGLPRILGTPQIEAELVRSRADPGGVSGLGAAVLAPAVANAIAAGTGKRLRSLPLDPMAT